MKKLILLFLALCFTASITEAQNLESYELGLNPTKMKWRQIKTDKVQVIFPESLANSAQRVANLIHFLSDSNNISLGQTSGRVSIILQNQTTIPNGFVSLIPFRSEFFMTPPQFNFSGSTNWQDLLTIHEYRHVQQFKNSRVGLTKLASILFGQNGWAFMSGTALPRWYYEGDAVATETALTSSGRGRTPEFDMEYRALRTEGMHYNYEKASAGSLKDFVPSHYQLGYNMIAYGRSKFGADIWGKTMTDASKYRGLIYPFSHSLKMRTGLRTKELYQEAMQHLDSLYEADQQGLELTQSEQVNKEEKRTVTNYRNAHFLNNEQLIVEKSGYDEIRTYYLINADGTEQRLFSPGLNFDLNSTLSVSDGVLAWAELTYHPRWFEKNFSVVRTHNLRNFSADSEVGAMLGEFAKSVEDNSFARAYDARKEKITSKSKYFAPDLSADATKVVAVHVPADLEYELVILNTTTGEVEIALPNPQKLFFAFPQWMPDQKHIVAVARNTEQSALVKINAQSGVMEVLTDWTFEQISNSFPSGEYVFFAGSFTGINNIFAVKTGSKQIFQVTSTKLGAYQPSVSPDGKKLVYSEFSSMGYNLQQMQLTPDKWLKVEAETENVLALYKTLVAQEGKGSILTNLPEEEFATKKYNKMAGTLNLHSWNPVVTDPFDPEGGVQVGFDNKISSFSAIAGYVYNVNEQAGRVFGEVAYGEFWPILRVGITGKNERDALYSYIYPSVDTITNVPADTIPYRFFLQSWQEESFNAGITLPFNITSGNFISNLEISADYHHIKQSNKTSRFFRHSSNAFVDLASNNDVNQYFSQETIGATEFEAILRGQQTAALQNIYPKWGYYFRLNRRNTVGSGDNFGNATLFGSRLFMPGFAKNHGILLTYSAQFQDTRDTYRFRNLFATARGYSGTPTHDKGFRFSANYALPLFYPDAAIGSLAFIKRIKATLFYDYASFTLNSFSKRLYDDILTARQSVTNYSSLGVELTTDFRAFRLLELDLGVRYSYLPDYQIAGESSAHQLDFLILRIGI